MARFRASLERLLSECGVSNGSVAVCVSGGPDSVSLLRHALAWNHARVVAFHVNHRVRAEADGEEHWLRGQLEMEGVPFDCRRLTNAKKTSHEALRQGRYAALGEMARAHGVRALLLAHHADDMAETFVERVQMASGVAGLARPIPEISMFPDLPPVLRPVLLFSKAELRSVLKASEVVLHDPSNENPFYLRSRVRRMLDETPFARERVSQVHAMMQQEWKAIEMEAGKFHVPDTELLLERGIRGEAARLALERVLAKATGSLRNRSSLVAHAISWMTRPSTREAPVSVFCESGVRITWRKKTRSFRSKFLFFIFYFLSFFFFLFVNQKKLLQLLFAQQVED